MWRLIGRIEHYLEASCCLVSTCDMELLRSSGRLSVSAMKCVAFVAALSMLLVVIEAQGKGPIPAPDIPTQCNSVERCCMPTPYVGKPIRQFEFPTDLPLRVRRPAHLLSPEEIAQLERGYKLLRELPDSDPRSLLNQKRLHCLYCDNALYYPGQKFPLAIHNGWLFFPWHRLFIYFHERILAKVLGDPSFALPYWNWDNSLATTPAPNAMPDIYANANSSLYDVNRNNCSFPPFLVDLDTIGGCTTKSADFIRTQNDRLQYTQIVDATTTSLFYGLPYRFGDFGGSGPGTFEDQPHGTVHAWVGNPLAQPPLHPFDDMGNFGRAAFDPIFYAHHTNVDRLWNVWRTIPGGNRTYPTDPDWLDSAFTYYDENGDLVKANVSQSVDSDKLRYTYASAPTPWLTNGVASGQENSIPLCNPISRTAAQALIDATPKHKSSDVLGPVPLTFKITRGTRRTTGTEVIQIKGIRFPNITEQVHWKAYLFYPQATVPDGATCPEFVGTLNFIPVVGQATFNPKRVWRVSIGPKLKQLGLDYVKEVVLTIVQTGFPIQNITFSNVKVIYDLSPAVTI